MRERLASIGGGVGIASQPGQGTQVVFNVPLKP
jgi:signal transduction histidine kinase